MSSTWTVRLPRKLDRNLHQLPRQVPAAFDTWRLVVETEGLAALRLSPGFDDEAPRGEWQGFRSSRLNRQYRVVYSVEGDVLLVHVVRVTAHEYRRS